MRALDLVADWPARFAVAGVLSVRRGGGERGDGPSGREIRRGVRIAGTTGDADRSFPWASVTKLCTALAVLVAVEEGTIALSDPAGAPGATVAHLLAHASGLAPDHPEPIAPPATRRIYSNAGYEVLGELLADRAGIPVHEYVTEAVFVPLGMSGAQLAPGASPAHGAEGTLCDLLALGAELLSPQLVSPETLAAATRVAFPNLPGVLPGFGRQDPNDWGLGFEIRDRKRPHWTGSCNSPTTFGHFGRSGSFLWVDPEARIACGALCDLDFGSWAAGAWPVLSDAVMRTLGACAGASKDG
ncbi:MAG: serine hydrolase domain-containing protein [Acidimicrobiales bacterium]